MATIAAVGLLFVIVLGPDDDAAPLPGKLPPMLAGERHCCVAGELDRLAASCFCIIIRDEDEDDDDGVVAVVPLHDDESIDDDSDDSLVFVCCCCCCC